MSETDLIPSYPEEDIPEEEADAKDKIEEYYAYCDYFEQQLSLQDLRRELPYRKDMLDEIQELMTEVCCSKRPLIHRENPFIKPKTIDFGPVLFN